MPCTVFHHLLSIIDDLLIENLWLNQSRLTIAMTIIIIIMAVSRFEIESLIVCAILTIPPLQNFACDVLAELVRRRGNTDKKNNIQVLEQSINFWCQLLSLSLSSHKMYTILYLFDKNQIHYSSSKIIFLIKCNVSSEMHCIPAI